MNIPPERTWLIVTAASAAAAAVSAVSAVLSFAGGAAVRGFISGISVVLFAACSALAWTIRSKVSEKNEIGEEVECLRLKRPGIETRKDEEIVPKGKMPDQ